MKYSEYSQEIEYDDDNKMRERAIPKLRTWKVVLLNGSEFTIEARYAFNNKEEGLVFRRGKPPYTKVVANFAHGAWSYFTEMTDGE